MRILLLLRSNLLFLCLLGLAFVLDQFGFVTVSSCTVAVLPLIAGLAGMFGSALNVQAQDEANAENQRINRQNQAFQSSENLLNRKWQEKMWNLQNQYNTPSALKERLKEAGWNPFLVSDSVGTASNAGSPGTPASVGAPSQIPMQPRNYSGFATGVSSAVGQYIQMKSVDANVANQNADTTEKILENAKEIYKIYGKEQANRYLHTEFASLNGSVEGGLYARQALASVQDDENQARLSAVNAAIAEKFGLRKADAEISYREKTVSKIEQEINESVQRIAESQANVLKIASDIKVNDAKIMELLSEYYRNCAEAGMFKKLGDKYVAETSTINGLREGLKTQLKIANDRNQLQYETESTIFESQEGARGYITSKEGKEQIAIKAGADANAVLHIWRQINPIVDTYTPSFIITEK